MRIKIDPRSPLWMALAAVFAVLRLSGAVAWPWWVVLSPLWGPWAVSFAVGAAMFALWFALYTLAMRRVDRCSRRAR